MKVSIAYPITNDPTGGGNQFLRCLKKEFIKTGDYTEDYKDADIILYNGHHEIELVSQLKAQYPGKKFVHRIDGLQKLYNKPSDERQDIAINFNKLSNGTIFQSCWAKDEFSKINFNPAKSTVIHNCADEQIFNKSSRAKVLSSKTKLLCTSWSPNTNKGFNFYKLLDKKLDFSRYDFTFIGNKPQDINYKNIKCFPPRNSQEISQELKKTDIFVSATVNDCCSNSIIEALSSGVPVFALLSGGNRELVKDGGLLFNNAEDFLNKIERLRVNLNFYKRMISIKTIKDVAASYMEFFKCI
jgi:glycosyltransferase involved in cell wall biosynthesis